MNRDEKDQVLDAMSEWRRLTERAMWKTNTRKNAAPELAEAAEAWNRAVRMINSL